MSSTSEINNFVDTMLDSKKQFEYIRLSFDKKNNNVTACLNEFRTDLEGILSRNAPSNNNEALQKMFEDAHEGLKQLTDKVATEMESTQKGMKLIQDYESSFNIAVFGKVKAGKSFLGNFIMGKGIRARVTPTSYDKIETPKVEVYDRGKHYTAQSLAEIQKSDEFFVDPNEATSSIQLFKLGGMTWFDTPGIGSVTWENENLAKDYVNNADLIVYASNSDASGQRQDFQEMKELHSKKKRFLLLLTQSDTNDEDEDEEGNIISVLQAKPAEQRLETEKYMIGELRKNGIELNRQEILTISAKLALESLAKRDEQLFADSHMGDFLKILTEITKNEGAKLKLETPGIRLNDTIKKILEQIGQEASKLSEMRKTLNEQKLEIEEKNANTKEAMYRQCQKRIEDIIHQKAQELEIEEKNANTKEAMYRQSGGTMYGLFGKFIGDITHQNAQEVKNDKAVSSQSLSRDINETIYEVINQNCLKISEKLAKSYVNSLCLTDIGELKQKTEKVKYTRTVINEYERSPRGLWEWGCSKVFGKKYYRSQAETRECELVIKLGVNESQIRSIALQKLQELFNNGTVDKLMQDIVSFYIEPLTKMHNDIQECLERTRTKLEQLSQC